MYYYGGMILKLKLVHICFKEEENRVFQTLCLTFVVAYCLCTEIFLSILLLNQFYVHKWKYNFFWWPTYLNARYVFAMFDKNVVVLKGIFENTIFYFTVHKTWWSLP